MTEWLSSSPEVDRLMLILQNIKHIQEVVKGLDLHIKHMYEVVNVTLSGIEKEIRLIRMHDDEL